VFIFIAGCWLVATVTVLLFGIDTRSASLEVLHRTASPEPVDRALRARPGLPACLIGD
jgi:hypothetical protein